MESVESIESSKACRLRWIRAIWRRFDLGLKVIAVVLMLVAGLHRLGTQSARLLWHTSKDAAIDLQYRFVEMQSWFSGQTVYHEIDTAVYPPASYLMLWPIFGWSTLVAAKWMFAFSCFASLAGLVWLFSMEGGAKSRLEYALLMLIPVTTYATGITIGNGQLDIYVIFGLVAAFTLLSRRTCPW